jgi:hypothetical protein
VEWAPAAAIVACLTGVIGLQTFWIARALDAIDRRLDRLEGRLDHVQGQGPPALRRL